MNKWFVSPTLFIILHFAFLYAQSSYAINLENGRRCATALTQAKVDEGSQRKTIQRHYIDALKKIKLLPKRILLELKANILSRDMNLDDIAKMHYEIAGRLSWSIPIGASIWIGSTLARDYGGVHNFFTEHNSNFVRGLGLIWLSHNMLASAAPKIRKEIAILVYTFFGLGNIAIETNWLGLRANNDFGDLSAAGAALVVTAAVQIIMQKNYLKKLNSGAKTN
jgi:hypothetical protein